MPAADPDPPLDAERIFAALFHRGVDYVLIGGLAVQTHGHMSTTFDVDVLPRSEPSNLARLADALNDLDARVLNPNSEGLAIDAGMLPRATLWQFATRHGPIDVVREAPGAPSYGDLRRRALEISLGDVTLAVAGRDDLISMKRARGRDVDLDDLAALTEPEHEARHRRSDAS